MPIAPGQAFASTGDVILRVDKRDDLPNAFGRADMFGRTRDRGFAELRYMGTDSAGRPVFRRVDVDVYTDETTISQMGLRTATVTAQQARNAVIASGIGASAPPATVGVLPPDTVQFALDPAQGRTITIQDTVSKFFSSTRLASSIGFGSSMTIVTYVPRPKRPPKKRQAVAITGPAIVRKAKARRLPAAGQQKPEPAVPPPPANDDRKPTPPGARKPAIVTSTSRKRTRLLRFEQPAEADDDPEATARVRAFFDRMIRPR